MALYKCCIIIIIIIIIKYKWLQMMTDSIIVRCPVTNDFGDL